MMIFKDKEVEVFEFNGRVLFNPYHCGDCLDLTESAVRNHLSKMNANQVIKLTNSDVRDKDIRKLNNAGENFITESGVYKLIFKSHKKEAEEFQDWVSDDVLPAIKKFGGYITPEKIEEYHQNPEALIEMIKGLEAKNSKLSIYIEENRENFELAEKINGREGTVPMAELAILLNQNGYKTDRTKLFKLFRLENYLIRQSLGGYIPTKKSIDLDLFRLGYKPIERSIGIVEMIPVSLVTIDGQKYFFEKLLPKNAELLSSNNADEQMSA
ncbi:MAG: phage antirepressor KilAC domain-containing protein [Eubacteriaceae bacterium]|nr:phage antirepressor KilAC domain-containing protein [Eubacteriaceae bacterium]